MAHQNGTPIVLQWKTLPAGALPDPVDGSVAGLPPQTKTLPAFVHQVQAAGASSVRQFNEVEVGHLILDFPGDAYCQRSEARRPSRTSAWRSETWCSWSTGSLTWPSN
jgi:hypothetical protein